MVKVFLFEPMWKEFDKIAKENDQDTVAMIHNVLMQALENYKRAEAEKAVQKDSMIVIPKGGMGEVAAKLKAQEKK